MPSFDFLLSLLSACVHIDSVFCDSVPSSRSDGVVAFSLFKRLGAPTNSVGKRSAGDFSITLANKFVWYGISLEIGTPGQQFELQIDTGSSDLWISNFDTSKSSTFHLNSSDPFSITYGDGTGAQGNFCQDTIGISGTDVVLKNANFAYAPDSMTYPQVCGIGLVENESSNNIYQNFPAQLKAQGQIAANLYSIYMGSNSKDGRIIFGGVDHSKYSGKLQKVPLKSDHQFIVNLDSVSFNGDSLYSSSLDVLLDSGTTIMLLPGDLVNSMAAAIDPSHDNLAVDCSKMDNDKSFQFTFSGAVIDVPFRNLIDSRSYKQDGSIPTSGQCTVGFQPTKGSTIILGDRFLMGAYVVFDLENKEIALANLDASSSGETIEAATTGGGIPGAVNAPLYGGGNDQSLPQSSSSLSSVSSASSSSQSTATTQITSSTQSSGESLARSASILSTNQSNENISTSSAATLNVTTIITDAYSASTSGGGLVSSSEGTIEYVTLYEPDTAPVRPDIARTTCTKQISPGFKRIDKSTKNAGTIVAPAMIVLLGFAITALLL